MNVDKLEIISNCKQRNYIYNMYKYK